MLEGLQWCFYTRFKNVASACPGFNFGVPRVRIDHWRNTPQTAPNEKMCFHEKLRLRSNTPGKSNVFWSRKSSFLRNYERKRINRRAFSTLRIGLRCHMRSTFEEWVVQKKWFSEMLTFLQFRGVWFWTFPKRFLRCCKDFAWNRDNKCCYGHN